MNKYKKLFNNTLIFGVGSMGTKILGYLLVIIYTRVFTSAEYSSADLIYNTVNMLYPLVTMSMADAVIRFGMDKGYDRRTVFTAANAAALIGLTVYMLFTPLVAKSSTLGEYAFLMYVYCYFSSFRQLASQFVRARGNVKLFAVDGIGATLVQLICNLIFLLVFKLGVTGYVLSFIVSDALSLIFLTLIGDLYKYTDIRFFNKRVFGEMIRFSLPLVPTYLLWWVTSSSDRWFMIAMVGEDANGIYALGYKLPTLLLLVTTMFYQAWQMSSIEERNSRDLGKFYETVFGAYSSLLYIGAAGLIMCVMPLTFILTGGQGSGEGGELTFFDSYRVAPILITAMIFQCTCQFLSSIYNTKKKSMNSCLTALVAAVVNLILNYLLIPRYGMYGAAIATAASYFSCFAVRIFDARKLIFFTVDYFRIFVNSVIIIVMCIFVAKQPTLWWLMNIVLFIIITLYNFSAIVKTLRRILAGRVNRKRVSQPNK
ncbi:MAG: polysaccharide biosynthesis C-terminal domain-containing protein [Oscillospiraceae bacterium]|nr:polysaccharide biosynthesis C-terminal domain-containing protein [Oscillospiraceae bacterium]